MSDLSKAPLSPAMFVRIPLPIYDFLIKRATDENVITQKGNPNPIPYLQEKITQSYTEGWDKKQPKIEVEINSNGEILEDITAKYVAICKMIDKYSHNGLEFYLKKADKELENLKKQKQ